jgi:hypothetical protein
MKFDDTIKSQIDEYFDSISGEDFSHLLTEKYHVQLEDIPSVNDIISGMSEVYYNNFYNIIDQAIQNVAYDSFLDGIIDDSAPGMSENVTIEENTDNPLAEAA